MTILEPPINGEGVSEMRQAIFLDRDGTINWNEVRGGRPYAADREAAAIYDEDEDVAICEFIRCHGLPLIKAAAPGISFSWSLRCR